MKNSIQIFDNFPDNLENVTIHATDDALGYFNEIRGFLEDIVSDLVELETGAKSFTPTSFELTMMLHNNIETVGNFLEAANQNSIRTADKVVYAKNILFKFSHIKKLMLSNNEEFRKDSIKLFMVAGNLYSNEEMKDFVSMLNESELKYVMQIIEQEKTLIEKRITNTPIHILSFLKLNKLKESRNILDEGDGER